MKKVLKNPDGLKLEHPLLQNQIDAAVKIRERLQGRKSSYKALKALSNKFPGFGPEDCLLKSVAVNSIYGTNVLAIVRVADHVKQVFSKHDLSKVDPAELVKELANSEGEGKRPRIHTSFASKFCHFFVSADRFPIYDDAACKALRLHFKDPVQKHKYDDFSSCIEKLKKSAGNGYDTCTIDDYLWLTGMYMRWSKSKDKKNSKVNADLSALFHELENNRNTQSDSLLRNLLPSGFPF